MVCMLTFANVDGVKTGFGPVAVLSKFTNIAQRVDEKHGGIRTRTAPRAPRKNLLFFTSLFDSAMVIPLC